MSDDLLMTNSFGNGFGTVMNVALLIENGCNEGFARRVVKQYEDKCAALAARQDGVRNALHEIVTNGEHTPDGGWKVSAEVYQLAYDADLFSDVEQGTPR